PEPAAPPGLATLAEAFAAALDDDLNTAVALATFGELAALANKLTDRKKLATIRPVFRAMAAELGLLQQAPEAWLSARRARLAKARNVDEAEGDQKIGERQAPPAGKGFQRAGEMRAGLAARGIERRDTPSGTRGRFKPDGGPSGPMDVSSGPAGTGLHELRKCAALVERAQLDEAADRFAVDEDLRHGAPPAGFAHQPVAR